MTIWELLLNILAGGLGGVPWSNRDRSEEAEDGRGWILGAVILIAIAIYAVVRLLRS